VAFKLLALAAPEEALHPEGIRIRLEPTEKLAVLRLISVVLAGLLLLAVLADSELRLTETVTLGLHQAVAVVVALAKTRQRLVLMEAVGKVVATPRKPTHMACLLLDQQWPLWLAPRESGIRLDMTVATERTAESK
jgi:hypothetical protein